MRISTLLLVVFATTSLIAQNATINLKGTITDERTNQGVGKDFEVFIVSKNTGKKMAAKVNAKTNDFLQPIQSGDTYYITPSSYFLYSRTDTLEVPSTSKYREERHQYKVRTILQGDEIANCCAFEPGQTTLAPSGMEQMRNLLDIIKKNRELNVSVYLAPEQTPPPPVEKKPAKPAKKAPKGKKGVETPEPEAVKTAVDPIDPHLQDSRIEVLKKFFSEAKNADIRVRIEQAAPLMAAPGQKNLVAKVGEVKSILED